MSQDLLAAFGESPTNEAGQRSGLKQGNDQGKRSDGFWDLDEVAGINAAAAPIATSDEPDEDDFGDFEDASPAPAQVPAAPVRLEAHAERQSPRVQATSNGKAPSFPPKAPATKKPLPFSPRPENAGEKVGRHPFADHMDLLFDAGEDDYDAGADELADLSTNPEAAMAYSKRLIAEQEAAQARKNPLPAKPASPLSAETQWPMGRETRSMQAKVAEKTTVHRRRPSPKPTRQQRNADVLFDADDVSSGTESERNDDWGDFEASQLQPIPGSQPGPTGSSSSTGPNSIPAVDLLSLDAGSSTGLPVKAMMSNTSIPTQPLSRPQTQSRMDEAWDDFETTSFPPQPFHTTNQRDLPLQPPAATSQSQGQLPPTNVPPPVVLLSLFPSIFAAADDALFSSLSKLPAEQKASLLAHPATSQYLLTYLSHCTALVYIIAGRKLRWKRDQRLAQSMRIGPAAAGGGKGGMKLVGVDRSEAAKEDREVLDTVRLYRAQMGRLQSATAGAGAGERLSQAGSSRATRLPAVPNLGDSMLVRALKPAEGGITAPRPCALCGLKREERVDKVDREVEDSFGEWWVEGVGMHVVCQDFWNSQGVKLGKR